MTTKNLDTAKDFFKKSELQSEPSEKLLLFKKALDELDALEESPELQDEIVRIRRSNTRSLLNQLPKLHHTDFDSWLEYLTILSELKDDVEILITANPTLNDNYSTFQNLHMDEAREIIKKMKPPN